MSDIIGQELQYINTLDKLVFNPKFEKPLKNFIPTSKQFHSLKSKVNKSALITYISMKTQITKKQATKVIISLTEAIQQGLQEDGKVSILHLGTFTVSQSVSGSSRVSSKGNMNELRSKKVAKFKPSGKLALKLKS